MSTLDLDDATAERIDSLSKYFSLVDALCLMESGWSTPSEQQLYSAARIRICQHGFELKKQAQIEELKQKIAELEGRA